MPGDLTKSLFLLPDIINMNIYNHNFFKSTYVDEIRGSVNFTVE